MYLFVFDDSENSYYISNGYNLDSALQAAYDYVGHGEVGPDEFYDMIVRLGKEDVSGLISKEEFEKIHKEVREEFERDHKEVAENG